MSKTFTPKTSELALEKVPLSGSNLIEAGAGTGKTYTIAGLFLRLVVEKQLPVHQILVVTFTKAATEELKERIQRTIRRARMAFQGQGSGDELLDRIVRIHPDPAKAQQLLHQALVEFDTAAIFTIHGFCQRVLQESAFETGSLFDTELVLDPTPLRREIAEDFWRRRYYPAESEWLEFMLQKASSPDVFLRLLEYERAGALDIIPHRTPQAALSRLKDYRQLLRQIGQLWPEVREEVCALIGDAPLYANIYGKRTLSASSRGMSPRQVKVATMREEMERIAQAPPSCFPLPEGIDKWTAARLAKSTRKGQPHPRHSFFDLCQQLSDEAVLLNQEMEGAWLGLKRELFDYAQRELAHRKQRRNIMFFDDLLQRVHQALKQPAPNALLKALRQHYPAALVDEFQDTDPVQCDIFTRLFSGDETCLFMIGDPKQAIYGFRGADIFSYLNAADQAQHRYTLSRNYRSRPGLIRAVNTLFERQPHPFAFERIRFHHAVPAEAVSWEQHPLINPALILWYLSSKGVTRTITKGEAVTLITASVAGEVRRLLQSQHIRPAQITVLVRTNQQAQIVKQALTRRRVPAVLYQTGNVFESMEALELERILASIAEPSREGWLKAALTTTTLGYKGEALEAAATDLPQWEAILNRFEHYHQLWHKRGFMVMMQMLIRTEQVKNRLLGLSDGERRLTNLLHLTELLHCASMTQRLDMNGLLRWLGEQRHPRSAHAEEHQLRLESDEKAVTIVTIHKSKGLQYDVVFCPFAWDGSLLKGREVLFHEADEPYRPILDLGSNEFEAHRQLAQKELLSENLRLLYVALTRARMRAYLVYGHINTAETSALAYLLHGPTAQPAAELVKALARKVKSMDDDDLWNDVEQLGAASGGSIYCARLPEEPSTAVSFASAPDPPQLTCRTFSGTIDSTWTVASYSTLAARHAEDHEPAPDRDTLLHSKGKGIEVFPEQLQGGMAAFPRGTRAGLFFHDLLEHLDFAMTDGQAIQALIADRLRAHGIALSWQPEVEMLLRHVCATPLVQGDGPFCLADIPSSQRLHEVEFYFPLKRITADQLQAILTDKHPVDSFAHAGERLAFTPAHGFMKGYIDMVFWHHERYYLVDWKSNYLGTDRDNYGIEKLAAVMRQELYVLQYLLYTLALHLFLRQRLPGYTYAEGFGGVFYLFLRGMHPLAGKSGIFYERPSWDLIGKLGRMLVPDFGE